MRLTGKVLLWGAAAFAFTALFYLRGGAPAHAAADENTPMTLLTEDGPVACTVAEYLPHAVAAEMPASFGAEALKAQAVAIRTFVMAAVRHGERTVCADSGCCIAWRDESSLRALWGGGYEDNWRKIAAAAAATDGQVLTYGGAPIQAAFHACSDRVTEASAAIWAPAPYLVSVASPETAGTVPGFVSTAAFTPEELAAALGIAPEGDPAGWLGDTVPEASGRVRSISAGGQTFSGSAVRSALGLRSTDFTAAWDGSRFLFTVYGSGHGVGMSQYGADAYAAQGWSYRDILAHYYPGTALEGA